MKSPILNFLAWVLLSTKVSQALFYQLDICEKVYEEEACTNGYYQELARILQHCIDPLYARRTQESCRSNEMGRYCDSFNTFFKLSNVSGQVCEAALMSGSASDCSPECRELLMTSRRVLGCCVTVHNRTDSLVEYVPFDYSLWSACGVEPVTEECPPSIISLPLEQSDRTTCTDSERLKLLQSFQCRRKYVEPIQRILSAAEGCQRDLTFNSMYTQDRCKVNQHGRYCGLLSQDTLYTDATRNCRNTSTCDPHCMETLSTIADTLGCCFNELYNTTGSNWLSYEFYSRCGLRPLSSCKVMLNDDAAFGAATITTDSVGMGASALVQSSMVTTVAAVLVTIS